MTQAARPGPKPQSFGKFIRSVSRGGVITKVRVITGDKETLVRWNGAPKTEATVLAMNPERCEALDKENVVRGAWEFDVEEEPEARGYAIDGNETEMERLLKTFAHIIADAHKEAATRMAQVLDMQARSFGDERRALFGSIQTAERVMNKLRAQNRFRVAEGADAEGAAAGEGEGGDNFMTEVMGPIIQSAVAQYVRQNGIGMHPAAAAAADANGKGGK